MYCPHEDFYNNEMRTFALLALLASTLAILELESTLPQLTQEIRGTTKKQIQIIQHQSWRYQYSPEVRIITKLQNICHIHPPFIDMSSLMSLRLADQPEDRQYSFGRNKNSLYEVNNDRITKYTINWEQAKITRENSFQFDSNCTKNILEQFQHQDPFIYSCEAVYQINAATLINPTEVLKHSPYFNSFKVTKFQELIFQISANEGVHIYSLNFDLKLKSIAFVTHFYDHPLHIADIYYHQNELFILDHKKGVLIYQRSNNQFTEKDSFSLKVEESIEYRLIVMNQNNLYIAFEGNGQSSVIECSFIQNSLFLIRYFKGYSFIDKMLIFNNQLLIQSQSKIDLFPINRDPRTIPQTANGYSYTHDNQNEQLYQLQNNSFLLTTPNNLQIVTLTPYDSTLECSFEDTGSYTIILQEPCGSNLKAPFYQTCTQTERLSITVTSSFKDSYYWLLLIVGGIFVITIASLICWREEKVQKITKLLKKIKEFQIRFQPKGKPVEFEEVEYGYSQELKAKQRNWEDLKQDYDKNQNQLQGEEAAVGTERGPLANS